MCKYLSEEAEEPKGKNKEEMLSLNTYQKETRTIHYAVIGSITHIYGLGNKKQHITLPYSKKSMK